MNVYFRPPGLRQPGLDHELVWGAIGLAVLIAARFVPPALTDFYRCPFHSITGIPCLTCGMTRAFRHMVHGRFYEAFNLNPLGALICTATILFVVYALSVVVFRLPRPRLEVNRSAARVLLRFALPGILFLNWIYLFLNGV